MAGGSGYLPGLGSVDGKHLFAWRYGLEHAIHWVGSYISVLIGFLVDSALCGRSNGRINRTEYYFMSQFMFTLHPLISRQVDDYSKA